jgi:hypothetical protein
MPLPAKMKALLQSESHAAHTQHMTEAKSNISNSNNIVRHSAARMVDEPSPQQARAIDKILRLPN